MTSLMFMLVGFISGFFIPVYNFEIGEFSVKNFILLLSILTFVEVFLISVKSNNE